MPATMFTLVPALQLATGAPAQDQAMGTAAVEDKAPPKSPNQIPEFNELPIATYFGWDRVQQIDSIINSHDKGNFNSSAILSDAMLRDDRIQADLTTRCNGLVGTPIRFDPANVSRKAQKVADLVGGTDDRPGLWSRMFPASSISDLLRWGLMLGVGVAEIVWRTDEETGAWVPHLKVWHPQFLYYRWDTGSYWLITQDGNVELPRTDRDVHSDGHWVLFTPYGFSYGWLRGLVRSLGRPYIARQWTYRDWARYDEVHGLAIRKAIVPSGADNKIKDRFWSKIANIASETVVECPTMADGTKFDIELVEAKADTYQGFDKFLERLEKSIAITITGQDMSQRAQGGSLAQAKDNIREDYRRFDATEIAKILYLQVLYWFAKFNFGDGLTPIPSYEVDPPEDELSEATALQAVATAVTTFANSSKPLPVDYRAILDHHGVPTVSEEEWLADQLAESPPAAPPQGLPPVGGGPSQTATATLKAVGAQRLDMGVVARRTFAGLPIAIESPRGTIRRWYDGDGKESGATAMSADYGFIEGHEAADGEDLDCYIDPQGSEDARFVYVIHQAKAPDYQRYDEDKVVLGAANSHRAEEVYYAHRKSDERELQPGPLMGMSSIPLEAFKAKLSRRTGTGRVRASAMAPDHDGEQDLALALLSMPALGRAELSARPGYGRKRSKLYADRLTDRATLRARAAMAPALAAIMGEVRKASSYEDLRRRIVARLPGLDEGRLAKVVEKARVMAQLAGRHEVIASL